MEPQNKPISMSPEMSMPPAMPPEMPMPMGNSPETGASAAPEQAPVPSAAPPMSAADASWLPPTVPLQANGQAGQPAAQSTSQTLVPVPAIADDGDLIEKEWVTKAKHIVEQTRQDPYKQTRELHKFRAEYMKKRYNKVIEPVEE